MKLHILIIEDDFRIANIHKEMIEKLAFCQVVHTALQKKDAIDFLRTTPIKPDLILLDIYIPDVNGLELVEELRTRYPYTAVIIASAANDNKTVMAAKRLGVFDYMVKPIEQDRLLESFQQFKKQIMDPTNEEWTQEQLDRLFQMQATIKNQANPAKSALPKGIDKLTLDKIMDFLPSIRGEYITAQILTEKIGVSRSTARRYLEYLDAIQVVQATLHYGQVGRPQRMYILHEQNEQN